MCFSVSWSMTSTSRAHKVLSSTGFIALRSTWSCSLSSRSIASRRCVASSTSREMEAVPTFGTVAPVSRSSMAASRLLRSSRNHRWWRRSSSRTICIR